MTKYDYEYERVGAYCYPNSNVLRNKLDIQDAATLEVAERRITAARIAELETIRLKGKLDFDHLCAIHRHVFQDVYPWAGELRNVNIAKGNQFCLWQHLQSYAAAVFDELKTERYLLDTRAEAMPERLAYYLSEINVLHPFREGNGRAQRVFIEYLAQGSGFHVDFSGVTSKEMIEASALSFAREYNKMIAMFQRIVSPHDR
jgi:cell filamentation protein